MPNEDADVEPTIPVDPRLMMKITDISSYNSGLETLQSEYNDEFEELVEVIESNRAGQVYVKESSEDHLKDTLLASPGVMNHNILIEGLHDKKGWAVDHSSGRNKSDLEKIGKDTRSISNARCTLDIDRDESWGKRSVDGIKNEVAVEAQFGKYAFMVYDVLSKFGHFKRANRINLGIELVPSKDMKQNMSTGVGYYEQIRADLQHLPDDFISEKHRIPTIVIGVGFEADSIDFNNLEEEVEHIEQKKITEY